MDDWDPNDGFLGDDFEPVASGSGSTTSPQDGSPDASTSSSGPTTQPQPKGASSRIRPCQGCRFRRVKCERDPGAPESADCTKCVAKGIACLPMPPRAKRKPFNRSGPLINAAKAKFGEPGQPPPTPPDAESSGTLVLATNGGAQLQPSSVSTRLNVSEIQGALVANLLDFYLESTRTNPTFFEEVDLRSRFEAAGRQMHQLEDQSQVLLACAAAAAARSSDHPLIVGDCPYRFSELGQAALDGVDLSEYGRRREAACSALNDNAIGLADEKRTLRVATLESMSSLMLLEELLTPWDDAAHSPQSPWTASYVGHGRRMLELLPDGKPMEPSTIAWTALFRDVMMSSRTGRSSTYTEDDLFLIFGYLPPSIPVFLSLPPQPDPARCFGELFDSWMTTLARTAMRTSRRLTGPIARRAAKLDEAFVLESCAALDEAALAVPLLTRLAFERACSVAGQTETQYFGKNFRTLRLMRCCLAFLLNHVVSQRATFITTQLGFVSAGVATGLEPFVNDPEYPQRVPALREETRRRAFEGAREVAAIFEQLLQCGMEGGGAWTDARGLELVFTNFEEWVSLLLDHPAAEEGGPNPRFTFDAKLNDLDVILKSVWSISWAFEKVGKSASWLQGELAKQRQRRDEFWTQVLLVRASSSEVVGGGFVPDWGGHLLLGGDLGGAQFDFPSLVGTGSDEELLRAVSGGGTLLDFSGVDFV